MKISKYQIFFFRVQDKFDKHGEPADDGDPEIYWTTMRILIGSLILRQVRNWWFAFYIWPKPFKRNRKQSLTARPGTK